MFQRANERMYEEKKALKALSAVTRDNEGEEDREAAIVAELDAEQPIITVRRHLLIVEDNTINQMILADTFKDTYELLYANDGYEALERVHLHKDELALILLDLRMPRLSGIEVLRTLKADDELRKIPVIVLTADQKAELECLNLGAMDFIPKPYPRWEIMRARVNKCIELSEDRDIIRTTARDGLTGLFNVDYFMRYVRLFDQHYADMPMIATVRELRGMGVGFRIEMDDFGTGYSSLGMLTHLPIDVLKLDMSFVRSAFGEKRDVRMIELIIDIADYLHVPVVAEGVETKEQCLALRDMGCDYVQGYYFSRPVPPEEFDRFIEALNERL